MYFYQKGRPTIYHYRYEQTRKVEQGGLIEKGEMPALRSGDDKVPSPSE
jgi:hypothetical protein